MRASAATVVVRAVRCSGMVSTIAAVMRAGAATAVVRAVRCSEMVCTIAAVMRTGTAVIVLGGVIIGMGLASMRRHRAAPVAMVATIVAAMLSSGWRAARAARSTVVRRISAIRCL